MATGRFAPSPTGPLHLGNLRTALVAWLFARSAGSRFLLRIEDLDPVASRDEHAAGHLHDLAALGIDHDGPVWRQSERRAAHEDAVEALRADGVVYECWCTRREVLEAAAASHGPQAEGAYPGTCRRLSGPERASRRAGGRPPALRLAAGGAVVAFTDGLAGPVEAIVDDVVVRRADGTPAYNLAVVIDDAAQGVEHVVRGDDLLLSTPRQLHVAAVLGLRRPTYAHVPLVLGPDGSRLAKRDGAVTLADRIAAGDTPAGVLRLLATSLGMSADVTAAATTAADLVERFDPAALPRAPWRVAMEVLHPGRPEGMRTGER